MKIIDENRMPKTGAEFVHLLERFSREPVPLTRKLSGPDGYPFFSFKRFVLEPGHPNLVNIWFYRGPDHGGLIVGGIKGPSANPYADARAFERQLESLAKAERYREALAVLDGVIFNFVAEHPTLFFQG